jgi:hypothetical protein
MTQPTVSATELFRIVDQEFSRLRPAACMSCRTPPPVRKLLPIGANWQLSAARPCDLGCRGVLQQIEARLCHEFRLEDRYV